MSFKERSAKKMKAGKKNTSLAKGREDRLAKALRDNLQRRKNN